MSSFHQDEFSQPTNHEQFVVPTTYLSPEACSQLGSLTVEQYQEMNAGLEALIAFNQGRGNRPEFSPGFRQQVADFAEGLLNKITHLPPKS
jgi:hypothetical protein